MARRRAAQGRDKTILAAKPEERPKRIKSDDRPKMGADGWREDWPDWAKYEINWPSRRTPFRSLPKFEPLNQHPNTRRYVQWMRLTHNGRRGQDSPCSECGAEMTEEDVAEFNALRAQRPSPQM
jgi:hypothetical protein